MVTEPWLQIARQLSHACFVQGGSHLSLADRGFCFCQGSVSWSFTDKVKGLVSSRLVLPDMQ